MKRILLVIAAISLMWGCTQNSDEMSPEAQKLEIDALKKVINNYIDAYQSKNFSRVVRALSDSVVFYGTDIEEKITSLAQFKEEIQAEWDIVSKIEYGEMKDLLIFMDDDSELAQVYYALPARYHFVGVEQPQSLYLRYARTLKKFEGRWLIVGGAVGAISTAQTAEAMMKKLMQQKEEQVDE